MNLYEFLKLKNNIPNLEYLKYEVEKQIYYYGDQFKHPQEKPFARYRFFKKVIKAIIAFLLSKLFSYSNNKPLILSSAYFCFDDYLAASGYNVKTPIWYSSNYKKVLCNWGLLIAYLRLVYFFDTKGVYDLSGHC